MAPTKKRSSIRAKAAARATSSSAPSTSFAELGAAFSEADAAEASSTTGMTYQPSKRTKRQAKHTSFLHRVASTGLTNSSGIKKKTKRSRGPEAKTRGKLVTSLSSLADALPDFEGFEDEDADEMGEGDGVSAGNKMIGIPGLTDVNISFARTRAGNIAEAGVPKKMKSLGTKKGMTKKKEKLETAERKRFQQNVAVMMTDEKFGFGSNAPASKETGDSSASSGAAGGLQALRAFIHRNMAVQKAL